MQFSVKYIRRLNTIFNQTVDTKNEYRNRYEKVVDFAEPLLDLIANKQLPVFLRHLGVWVGYGSCSSLAYHLSNGNSWLESDGCPRANGGQ